MDVEDVDRRRDKVGEHLKFLRQMLTTLAPLHASLPLWARRALTNAPHLSLFTFRIHPCSGPPRHHLDITSSAALSKTNQSLLCSPPRCTRSPACLLACVFSSVSLLLRRLPDEQRRLARARRRRGGHIPGHLAARRGLIRHNHRHRRRLVEVLLHRLRTLIHGALHRLQ